MLAALGFLLLVDKEGFVPIKLEVHGEYKIVVQDNVYSFPIWQRARVLDSQDRVVFDHTWKEDGSYVELYPAPDFDGDGEDEVVVAEYNYSATGASVRLSVHSLGRRARNLLVLYSHTWGRLFDEDFHIRTVDNKPCIVSWQNELPYWIGPRGGAPYPVVFAYSDGRLRQVFDGIDAVLKEHLAKAPTVDNPGQRPDSFGDFYAQYCTAASELATRTISEQANGVISRMRQKWSQQVMDFLESNIETLTHKPRSHVYAEPYGKLPDHAPRRNVAENEPIWPESTKYLISPQKW